MKKVLIVMMALCFWFCAVASAGYGEVLYEYWAGEDVNLNGVLDVGEDINANGTLDGIGGTAVSNLTGDSAYPNSPSGSFMLVNGIDGPNNSAAPNNFGSRITGYIIAPQTAEYRFKVCSDDNSELWLSSDGDPANAVLVSQTTNYASHNDFADPDIKESGAILLLAGRKYHFMTLQKEGGGGDNISVGWISDGTVIGSAYTVVAAQYVTTIPPSAAVLVSPQLTDTVDNTQPLDLEFAAPVIGSPVQYRVYFSNEISDVQDPNNIDAFQGMVSPGGDLKVQIAADTLGYDDQGFWRVDAIGKSGAQIGDPNYTLGYIWSFETLSSQPQFTDDPDALTVWPGEDAVFHVEAMSPNPATPITGYEWFDSKGSLVGAEGFSGADTDTLTVLAADIPDDGKYYCVATNGASEGRDSTASASARLTVRSMVAHYEFEELDNLPWHDGGIVLNDSAPYNGNNIGIIQGTDDAAAAGVLSDDGIIGKALRLHGLGQGINVVVGSVGISGNQPRTIACWVKEDTDAWYMQDTFTNIFGFSSYPNGGTNRSFDFNRRSGNDQFCIHVYSWERNIVTRNGDWQHLVATYDGNNTIHWYMNGREARAGVNGAEGSPEQRGPLDTDDYVVMGKRGHEEKYFAGMIDDARIYNYALDADEVVNLYLLGKPDDNFCKDQSAGDIDGDCDVDMADLMIFVDSWVFDGIVQ